MGLQMQTSWQMFNMLSSGQWNFDVFKTVSVSLIRLSDENNRPSADILTPSNTSGEENIPLSDFLTTSSTLGENNGPWSEFLTHSNPYTDFWI